MLDWKQENSQWFCYKNNQKIKGWIQDEEQRWFHLNDKDNSLDTEFFQTATDGDFWFYAYPKQTEKDGNTHYTGEMATGWQCIDNSWYYFCPEKTINYSIEYCKGSMMTNWYKIENKWFYFIEESDPNKVEYKGQMVNGCTREIDSKSYTFNKDGSLVENKYILSSNGADFIGSWEGFYSHAYEDPYYKGNKSWWTIGYGTTYAVTPEAFPDGLDSVCTIEQARQWLQSEAQTCAKAIKEKLNTNNITLSTNAMDSLISFSYNCGTGALFNSTLWKNIINGITDRDIISANFCAYSKANGVTSAGLLKRRKSEVSLYFDANYTGNN